MSDPKPSAKVLKEYARQLGARGGAVGGPARARKLTAEQRSDIARKAANARWKKRGAR